MTTTLFLFPAIQSIALVAQGIHGLLRRRHWEAAHTSAGFEKNVDSAVTVASRVHDWGIVLIGVLVAVAAGIAYALGWKPFHAVLAAIVVQLIGVTGLALLRAAMARQRPTERRRPLQFSLFAILALTLVIAIALAFLRLPLPPVFKVTVMIAYGAVVYGLLMRIRPPNSI